MDEVVLDVRVIPRASRTMLAGTREGAIIIRLAAPPVEGAANAELVAFLAKLFGIPKRNVAIVSGDKSRNKRVRMSGVSAHAVEQVLRA